MKPKKERMTVDLKKRRAYVAVVEDDGHRLGIAVENERGFHLVPNDADLGGTYKSREDALEVAKSANEKLGLTEKEAMLIVASTMRRDLDEKRGRRK